MKIIIAIIGTITTVITVCLTNYFSKRNELKFSERKMKEKYYFEYIDCVSDNANYSNEEATLKENKAFNELILIANTDVLIKLYELQDMRIKQIKYNDVQNYQKKFEQLFQKLIIEMRKDLYGKKEKNFPKVYLLGGYLKSN